ncbi:MAG: GlxA family transcriptional regulator [Pseudomonadota bacterium]
MVTDNTTTLTVIVTPRFNMAATMQFLDPFRVANYLDGAARFRWQIASASGGDVPASNGLDLQTIPIDGASVPDIGVTSASWTPDAFFGPPIDGALRRWVRFGAAVVGLDTGSFILAAAGLLSGHRATVHYEHIDALAEMFPDVTVTEDLYTIDRSRMTACGGSAATDLALKIVAEGHGPALANACARYIFHDKLRPEATRQLPDDAEPLGPTAPPPLRRAIQAMEEHLESPLPIPEIAALADLSHRQLDRLFNQHIGRAPQSYYTKIRLDRARSLVMQTTLSMREIALASGFSSPEHFSRSYRAQFGVSARRDRADERLPFEFRAWPMHPKGARR